MRICVTNDDGVGATGIEALTGRLRADGHDVVVVAPYDERSGSGTGLGRVVGGDSVRWRRTDRDGVTTLAVDAPPAMCVVVAMGGLVGPRPDVVVSGINHGPNLGYAVLHSGTVGAALTAHIAGVPALAVSVGEPASGVHGALAATGAVWDRAAGVASVLVDRVGEWGGRWVPNVNVPSAWPGGAVRCCRLAPTGAIELAVDSDESAVVRLRRQGDDVDATAEPADRWPADMALNSAGVATVTPLSGVTVSSVDRNEVEALFALRPDSPGIAGV